MFPLFKFRVVGQALVAILLLGVAGVPIVAQETPPAPTPPPVPTIAPLPVSEPEVALEELIRRALANSPQLVVARETLEAARQRARGARVLGDPTLQVVPGIGNREARDEELIVSQPLDVFGRRRARGAVAAAEMRRAQAESTLAERTLVVAVKAAAAELFAAQEAESLAHTQVEVAKLFRDAAARRAELGDVPPVQVERAELELLRMQNELTNARSDRLARRSTLNQQIGQNADEPLRVALPAAAAGPQTPAATDTAGLPLDVMARLGDRPDILSARATVEARRSQAQLLQRERRPEVAVQARRSSVTGSGSLALRAVITVPLFNRGSTRYERDALEAEARAVEAQIVLLRSQAAAALEQALVRQRQHRETVERYRTEIVPRTLELLRKTQVGYAQGASGYLEVLEAQRTLRQVQTEYLQALAGSRIAETQLETALGGPLNINSPDNMPQVDNAGGAGQ